MPQRKKGAAMIEGYGIARHPVILPLRVGGGVVGDYSRKRGLGRGRRTPRPTINQRLRAQRILFFCAFSSVQG